jgi:hypothetical protein
MQHLEVSGAVVLYIGRTVSKGQSQDCHGKSSIQQQEGEDNLHALNGLPVKEETS